MTDFAVSGIHHVNFTVTDANTSAEWYIRVLGLEAGWEMEDVEGRGRKIVLLLPGSSLRFVLTQHQANDGRTASEFNTGLDHIALTVPDIRSLEAWTKKLDKLGVDHSPIKEGATGWLVTLRDPDNIQLELYTVSKS